MTRRFVLDSNLFQGLGNADLESLGATASKLGFKLSISETALAETWARSVRDRAPGLLFGRVRKLAPYVDPKYPIAVAGGLGITRARGAAGEDFSFLDEIALGDRLNHLSGLWRGAQAGFDNDVWLKNGPTFGAQLDEFDKQVRLLATCEAGNWAELRGLSEAVQLERIKAAMCQSLRIGPRTAERLDAQLSVGALNVLDGISGGRHPKENDGADQRLLVHLGEGSFLLSRDANFMEKVDRSGTFQSPWVRAPSDLDDLPAGLPWGEEARSQGAAFLARQESTRRWRR